MNYFITAIGTDSGKTLVSAIFLEALGLDYWKPVQAGTPTDTDVVKTLVTNPMVNFHKEAYRLDTPASPHAAAQLENLTIQMDDFILPSSDKGLIIEGAGGLMVPLNEQDLVIDIAKKHHCEIILVCNLYLGSINHSLLSIEYLKSHHYKVRGIVFNGERNLASEKIILQYAKTPCILHIEKEKIINKEIVKHYAGQLKKHLES